MSLYTGGAFKQRSLGFPRPAPLFATASHFPRRLLPEPLPTQLCSLSPLCSLDLRLLSFSWSPFLTIATRLSSQTLPLLPLALHFRAPNALLVHDRRHPPPPPWRKSKTLAIDFCHSLGFGDDTERLAGFLSPGIQAAEMFHENG